MFSKDRVWRFILASLVLVFESLATAKAAPAQGQTVRQPSLGDLARQVRAERARQRNKPVKVFTNDNLPRGSEGLSIVGPAKGNVAAWRAGTAATPSNRGEAYFRQKMSELEGRLQLDQRELAVLQQQLNLHGPVYYSNPQKTLMQEYSRSDLNTLSGRVRDKQQQVAADEQAITNLKIELRRAGGDPGWLRNDRPMLEKPEPKVPAAPHGQPAGAAKLTTAQWQARLTQAREALASAEEAEKLASDELHLLRVRQARELDTNAQKELADEIASKQAEVNARHADVEKARSVLQELQTEFARSGAPADSSEKQ